MCVLYGVYLQAKNENQAGYCSPMKTKQLLQLQKKFKSQALFVEQLNEAFSPMVLLSTMYFAIEMSLYLYGFVIVTLFP